MSKKEFINKVCNYIKYKEARSEIEKELDSHIEDLKEELYNKDKNNTEEDAIKQMGDAKTIASQFNKIYKPKYDWIFNTIIILILIFGIIIGFSLKKLQVISNMNTNIISIFISVILGIGILFINYKKIEKYPFILFGIAFTITIAAHFIEVISNFYILILASYVIAYSGLLNKHKLNWVTIAISLVSLITTLFILGKINFLILLTSFIIVTFSQKIVKINKKLFSIVFTIISIILCILVLTISGYSKAKLEAYGNPEEYATDEGYIHVYKNKILSNSKFIGDFNTNINEYIGNIENDNIFTYLIANYGILFATLTIIGFCIIIYRIILNFNNIKDPYGKNIYIGLSTIIIIQTLLNILNGLNLIPYINVKLPLITMDPYNLICNIITISICISIYRRKNLV